MKYCRAINNEIVPAKVAVLIVLMTIAGGIISYFIVDPIIGYVGNYVEKIANNSN